jgi:hypothetical protein
MKEQFQRRNRQLDKILETCIIEYGNDVRKGEEMWEKVSEKIFK